MNSLTQEEKTNITQGLIKKYEAQLYQFKLELRCAEAIEDEQWIENIRKNTQRMVRILDVLAEENDL